MCIAAFVPMRRELKGTCSPVLPSSPLGIAAFVPMRRELKDFPSSNFNVWLGK